jgi:hypothetical protein
MHFQRTLKLKNAVRDGLKMRLKNGSKPSSSTENMITSKLLNTLELELKFKSKVLVPTM